MNDDKYIRLAIEEARKGSWPFGSVIVHNGEIVSQAGSGDGKDSVFDPTAHAETNAIRRACERLKTDNLSGCVMYSSCEPCVQCFGAAWYAGIKKIVYGISIQEVNAINNSLGQSGHLGFPHEYVKATGIDVQGGVLLDEAKEMYLSHPRVTRKEV